MAVKGVKVSSVELLLNKQLAQSRSFKGGSASADACVRLELEIS
jgi:hypothetical protein